MVPRPSHPQRDAARAARLAAALAEDALTLAYQPIVRLADRRVQAVEALLRWNDDGSSPVPPQEVVALAERHGLIDELGTWVLRRALADLARWRATRAGRTLVVNVNVSALQFADPEMPRRVDRLLALHDLPADALVLELTETSRLPPGAGRTLGRLARLGIEVSIDDVGCAYATAMRVHGLPARELKLEVELLQRAADTGGTFARLVRRAVDGGLRGVVERVETEAQLRAAMAAGSTHAQGFLLGRPGPAADVPAALRSRRGTRPPSAWSAGP